VDGRAGVAARLQEPQRTLSVGVEVKIKTDRSARTFIRGHALIQNLRRGHYELGTEARPGLRVAAAFDELQQAI